MKSIFAALMCSALFISTTAFGYYEGDQQWSDVGYIEITAEESAIISQAIYDQSGVYDEPAAVEYVNDNYMIITARSGQRFEVGAYEGGSHWDSFRSALRVISYAIAGASFRSAAGHYNIGIRG